MLSNDNVPAPRSPAAVSPSRRALSRRGWGGDYAYDAFGNRSIAGNLSFDANNKMTAFTGPVGGMNEQGTYVYDGQGNRVKRTSTVGSTTTTTTYVYDAFGKLAAEYSSAAPAGSGGRFFRTADHLGSTRLVTDGSQTACEARDFYPFGERIASSVGSRAGVTGYDSSCGFPQQFTAKERDQESGLDYFGARYMSSTQGRFTSVDPENAGALLSDPQSWNGYAYVTNRPLTLTDPDGRCPWCLGALVGAAVGAGAQVIADVATGKEITVRKTVAAAVGGAIVGGTAGAASELGLAVQIAIVGDAGVVAGIAESTIKTGSLDEATDDPGEIAVDFAGSAAGQGVTKLVEGGVERVAGGAVRELTRQEARAQTAARQSKVAGRLETAKTELEARQAKASATIDTASDAARRSQEQKRSCSGDPDCQE